MKNLYITYKVTASGSIVHNTPEKVIREYNKPDFWGRPTNDHYYVIDGGSFEWKVPDCAVIAFVYGE